MNHDRTIELLKKHRDELEKLAEALLEREVLDHHALRELLGDRPHGKYPDGIFEQAGKSNQNGVSEKKAEDKTEVADQNKEDKPAEDAESTTSSTEQEVEEDSDEKESKESEA